MQQPISTHTLEHLSEHFQKLETKVSYSFHGDCKDSNRWASGSHAKEAGSSMSQVRQQAHWRRMLWSNPDILPFLALSAIFASSALKIEVCGVVIEDGKFMCKWIFVLSGTRNAKCIFVAEHIKESVYQSANIQPPYTYQRCISLLCIHRRTVYKHLSSFPRKKRAPFSALGFCWRRYICCGVITCQRWQLHRWTKLHIL